MATAIANALLPVFFVMALGYVAGRSGIVDNRDVRSLNTILMSIALPVSLFTSLASSSRPLIVARWPLALTSTLVMRVVYIGTYVVQRRVFHLAAGASAVQALTVSFPNLAAIGLPLVGSALGPDADLGVAAAIAVGAILLSPATLTILERERRDTGPGEAGGEIRTLLHAIGSSMRKPIVIGPLLGLAWSLLGVPMPDLLQTALTEIGSVTAGLALFLTGLVLSAQPVERSRNALVSTLLSTVARPVLAFLALGLFDLAGGMAAETLLLLAIPAGFFGVLLGIGYDATPPVAGTTLLLSSVLSVVTLSALIVLLPQL